MCAYQLFLFSWFCEITTTITSFWNLLKLQSYFKFSMWLFISLYFLDHWTYTRLQPTLIWASHIFFMLQSYIHLQFKKKKYFQICIPQCTIYDLQFKYARLNNLYHYLNMAMLCKCTINRKHCLNVIALWGRIVNWRSCIWLN